uniref:Pentacotripeptide-repeat region of PRORP domain-containing protein n=1 Tax=Manihot esculenta TaxID=3983 RepID=A0A199UCK7_MANES
MMMKMPWRRKSRSFHLQLQGAIGTIQSPFLFLFTNYFHSSTSTLEDARFLTNNFKSASFTHLDDAIASFNHVIHMNPLPSRVHFNRFLSALAKMKQYHFLVFAFQTISDHFREALALLKEMVGRNISPNVFTFNILIDTLCKKGLVSNAENIIKIMIQRGVSLMDGYCLCNHMDKAKKLFDLMVTNEIANIFSYTILINGYCKYKMIDDAKDIFVEMSHKGLVPDVVTYSTLIEGRPQTAQELFKDMCSHGQQPNIVTFSIMINGLCSQGNLDDALTLLKKMEESQLKPNLVTYCILINGMCKAGKINDAKELFSSLFENGLMDEAYKVFKDMEKVGCLPNNCCYNIIIQGFLKHEDLPKASELINKMVDKGFSADVATMELIVDEWRSCISNDQVAGKPTISLQFFIGYYYSLNSRAQS